MAESAEVVALSGEGIILLGVATVIVQPTRYND